jgi:uncharacterized protein YbjT (DUF2867 family)
MTSSDRTIAVTGATGRQGGAVAASLLADGWRVRAITRKPQGKAARRLAGLGAEVVGADMADRQSLVHAFRGAHGVYSVQNPMISGHEGEITQGKTVGDAALQAGVAHVVYGGGGVGVAGTGVSSWESKIVIRTYLETLGLPLTVLTPTAFTELMTDKGFFPGASTWNVMPRLTGADLPISWISVEDLGRVAALAFADPDRFVGTELKLTADVQSNAECRAIWRTVTGRKPPHFPMPTWLFERIVGTDLTTMWRWLRTARPQFDPGPTRELLPTVMTVEQWLRRRHAPSTRTVGA